MPIAVGMGSRGFDPRALPGLLRSIEGVTRNLLPRLRRVRADPPLRRDPAAAIRWHPTGRRKTGLPRNGRRPSRLRRLADTLIDPTDLTRRAARAARRYGGDVDQPVITIVSFGFARGISRTADWCSTCALPTIPIGSTSFAR